MTLLTDPLLTSRYDGSGMYTSGSGQGPQNLAQRTISKQVTQQHLIGSGRFGHVYKGLLQIYVFVNWIFGSHYQSFL